jgi:hypothetical protein
MDIHNSVGLKARDMAIRYGQLQPLSVNLMPAAEFFEQ